MKTPPRRPLERDIQRSVIQLLRLRNIHHFRSNAGGGLRTSSDGKRQPIKGAPTGWPDITGWLPNDGRFLGIEVKRPGNKPTPDQVATLRAINAEGGVGFWTDDVKECAVTLDAVQRGAKIRMNEKGGWNCE